MTEEKVTDPNITSEDKTWALLSYIFTPLIPVILMLIEDKKDRPYLKTHYPQALAWGIVLFLVESILSATVILAPVALIIGAAGLVLSILWGIKAYNGEFVEIPVISDFVKKQGWSG